MVTQELIDAAIAEIGAAAVHQSVELVAFSDPDGAYTVCEDTGQFEIAEAIEFLYLDK